MGMGMGMGCVAAASGLFEVGKAMCCCPCCACVFSCTGAGSGERPGRGCTCPGSFGVVGEWAAERGGAFLRLQNSSVAGAGVTSTLGQGTQHCVSGVAYHLGEGIGTKYKVL